jgi:release factor glutamine methyltransferase
MAFEPTVRECLAEAASRLAAAGCDEAQVDARRLICATLRAQPASLIADPDRRLAPDELATFTAMIHRRLAREPVSRILGTRDFYGRTFEISPAVLDPRPDTETIVEVALSLLAAAGAKSPRILDIGTGSGAILLTLLAEMPEATGLGIDVSEAALAMAEKNALALGLTGRARLERGDLYAALPANYDLWVSNPPYIPTQEIATLDPEVEKFDPVLALDGGTDGLDAYRAIVAAAVSPRDVALRPRWVVLEAGAGQSAEIVDLAAGFGADPKSEQISLHRDLGGHVRCVVLQPQLIATCEKDLDAR